MLGIFKDEAGWKQIIECVGLRAKLYSYKMLHGSVDKKCKGETMNATKSSIQSMTTESLGGRNNIEK